MRLYLTYTQAERRWCLDATILMIGMGVNSSIVCVRRLADSELQGIYILLLGVWVSYACPRVYEASEVQ